MKLDGLDLATRKHIERHYPDGLPPLSEELAAMIVPRADRGPVRIYLSPKSGPGEESNHGE